MQSLRGTRADGFFSRRKKRRTHSAEKFKNLHVDGGGEHSYAHVLLEDWGMLKLTVSYLICIIQPLFSDPTG